MIALHPDQAKLDLDAPATRGRTRKTDPKSCRDGADQMSAATDAGCERLALYLATAGAA